MKYKLIKIFPGCLFDLGTIVEKGKYGYILENSTEGQKWSIPFNQVENYPEFWQPVYINGNLQIEDIEHLIKVSKVRTGSIINADNGVRLEIKELGVYVDCYFFKSFLKNKEVALLMLQTLLNTLPKSVQTRYKYGDVIISE